MLRIGRISRAAKMNATTPPKLMPPLHSTAASGTVPIEQEKRSRAAAAEAEPAVPEHGGERDVADRADEGQDRHDRPDDRPPQRRDHRVVGEEERAPERLGHPGADRAG